MQAAKREAQLLEQIEELKVLNENMQVMIMDEEVTVSGTLLNLLCPIVHIVGPMHSLISE